MAISLGAIESAFAHPRISTPPTRLALLLIASDICLGPVEPRAIVASSSAVELYLVSQTPRRKRGSAIR